MRRKATKKGSDTKTGPEERKEARQKEREIIKRKDRNKIHKKQDTKRNKEKKKIEMGSNSKGWYCIVVAMVTESQNLKSSRTANRRPHPAQPNLHPSEGTARRSLPPL